MKAKLYPDTNSYICYDETGLKSGELGIPYQTNDGCFYD